MKRITSLLFVLLLVCGVSASSRPRAPKAKSDKQKLEQRLVHARSAHERDRLTYLYKQQLESQALSSPLRKVSAVLQEKAEIPVDRYNAFIMNASSVLYGLHNEEQNLHFFFQFPLPDGAFTIEFGKTYTLDEMIAEGSEWDEYDEEDNLTMHYYTSATFRIAKGEGYDIHILASVTDDQGKEFTLVYDEEPLVPTGETVDVSISRPISDCSYNEEERSWLVRAQDNNYFVQLQYYSADKDSPAGSFAAKDIELTSTYLSFSTGELNEYDEPVYKELYAKDAAIEFTQNDKRMDVNASILAEDGVRYNITLFYALPEAESHEDFVANNLKIDTWAFEAWGEVAVSASTEDGKSVSMSFYSNEEQGISGTYTISPEPGNMDGGSVSIDGESYGVYSGEVTIAYENEKYSVSGTILCWNNVEYTLNLQEPDVVVSPMNFESEGMVIDVYPEDQFFEVAGFDADGNYLLLTVNSSTVSGDFSAEVDSEYTYLEIPGATYDFVSADIHVSYDGTEATVSGTLRMINIDDKYDVIDLSLNLHAGPYVPSERDVTLSVFYRSNGENNTVVYMLAPEDRLQNFTFIFEAGLWEEDIQSDSVYTLDAMLSESFGINFAENEYIVYESVSLVKTETENGVRIVATVVDTRGNTWHLTYEGVNPEMEGLFVDLGQANAFQHADGGLEYEMVDKENTFSCHLVMPGIEGEDVEPDSLYSSLNGSFDFELSYLSIQKVEYKLVEASFRKEVEGSEVWVSADVTDERGFVYKLRFYDEGFVLTGDTVYMNFDAEVSANYSEDENLWYLYAEGSEHIVSFAVMAANSDSPVGTYTEEDVELWSSHVELHIEGDNWAYIGLHSIEFVTVSQTEKGFAIEAEVVGEDGVVYVVNARKQSEAIEHTHAPTEALKLIRNGQVIILLNGVEYTVQGVRIR